MKNRIRNIGIALIAMLFTTSAAMTQEFEYEEVTIKDLNSYEEDPQKVEDIANHPLGTHEDDVPNDREDLGEEVDLVSFTAVIVSNPKSSGMASFDDEDDDDDSINRIHFFVIDTEAEDQGKEGMYMHVVTNNNFYDGESAVEPFEEFVPGDVVEFKGFLTYFGGHNVPQFTPTTMGSYFGNVYDEDEDELHPFQDLLEPIKLSVSDINKRVDDGDGFTFRPDNYTDYISAYVEFEGVEIMARNLDERCSWEDGDPGAGRPDFYWTDQDGIAMTYNDISLRYRNDSRADACGGYRPGYNYLRGGELFEPPRSGSVVNLSGFVMMDSFDAFDLEEDQEQWPLQLAPMEDGIVWDGGQALTHHPEYPDVPWPNDIEPLGFPPNLAAYDISNTTPKSEETVLVEVTFDEEDEVENAELTYWTTQSEEEMVVSMDESSSNTFEHEFSAFDEFTSVEFEITATTEVELEEGTTTDITARFQHEDVTAAGEELDMRFTQVGEALAKISHIQTTFDGDRGPSPLTGLDFEELEVGIELEGVVVADSSNGFVVVHDSDGQFSGLPLEASEAVADLEIGDRVSITGGEITNAEWPAEYNTYMAELEDADVSVISNDENPGDYIPTISVDDAVVNDGAAYEGMIIRLENVTAVSSNPDAPNDNFGEWTITETDADNGSELRVRNELAFDAVIGDFDTVIPFGFNDHIIEGSHFNAVYGYMSNSFGDPAKIHLRTLEDLYSDEDAYTIPVRDIALIEPEAEGTFVIDAEESNEAVWEMSESYDGNEVSYHWILGEMNNGEIENPVIELDDVVIDEEQQQVTVSIPEDELENAFTDAGYSEDEAGDFQWSVVLTHEGIDEEFQAASMSGDADWQFVPFSNDVTVGYHEVVSSEDDGHIPQTVELNQNYPNPFNPVTNIEYQLPEQAEVKLTVYDVLGRQVSVLVDDHQQAGTHTVSFDGSDFASGMYIYRLETGETAKTKQMMLVK